MARKEKIVELRNAIFDAADGLQFDEIMQAIVMAQSRIVANTVGGDEQKMSAILACYREIQDGAIPIYCAEEASAGRGAH